MVQGVLMCEHMKVALVFPKNGKDYNDLKVTLVIIIAIIAL